MKVLIPTVGERDREGQRVLSSKGGRGLRVFVLVWTVSWADKMSQFSLRLKTLLDKRKVMQSRSGTASKASASFVTLFEGFQQFDYDLNKLQVCKDVRSTTFLPGTDVAAAIRRNQRDGHFEDSEEGLLRRWFHRRSPTLS